MRYEEKIEIKHKLCPECLSENVETDHELVSLPIEEEWEETEYFLPVINCNDCGESSKAFEAPEVTHGAVCRAMGLLSPWEIRNIRKELDVNAQDFAKALGLGVASIKRWESRAKYPGRSASILMKLAKHHGLNHISEIDNKDNTRPEGDNVVPLFPESNKLSDEQKEIDRKKIEKFDKRFSARARAS